MSRATDFPAAATIVRWRFGNLSDAELQAAFLAARGHGKILADDVLSAIVAAVAQAERPAANPASVPPMPLADGVNEDSYAEYLSSGSQLAYGDWVRQCWRIGHRLHHAHASRP